MLDPNNKNLVVTHIGTWDPDSKPIWSLSITNSNGETIKFDDYRQVNSVYALPKGIKLIAITTIYPEADNWINNLVLHFADGTTKELGQ